MILPACRCGHGWLGHTEDDGLEGACLAEECACPYYTPGGPLAWRRWEDVKAAREAADASAPERATRGVRIEHHPRSGGQLERAGAREGGADLGLDDRPDGEVGDGVHEGVQPVR